MLLCLADWAENALGDPLLSIEVPGNRRRVLAYGHRLFCDSSAGLLRHRWGSSKLYRLYYRDYQNFLRRPEAVANQLQAEVGNNEVAIVQSDLSKFYDRIRPPMLHQKVRSSFATVDPDFLSLFEKVFDWRWNDVKRAQDYGRVSQIDGFETIALPQGLVASGFFANIFLRDFDSTLRNGLDHPIDAEGRYILKDVSYYVDDLRIVLLVNRGAGEADIQKSTYDWLTRLLEANSPGLVVEEKKTIVTVVARTERFLVRQSQTATRIQREVSGVFDMLHGTELIGAIEGFFHTQKRYPLHPKGDSLQPSDLLGGTSDMRDDTATRFAAGKFRRTFRSLRPLIYEEDRLQGTDGQDQSAFGSDTGPTRLLLTRQQLDERGRLFSATLIEEWVSDPVNVRLLRIALDLYPDVAFLERILALLRPGWDSSGPRGCKREVRLYCLAEIFRAGATETGVVSNAECLPSDVDLEAYHQRLRQEAKTILLASVASPTATKRFPWYLLQQVFLYLAVQGEVPDEITIRSKSIGSGLRLHQRFAYFMKGNIRLELAERAIFTVLGYSAFGHKDLLERSVANGISSEFLRSIVNISPGVAGDLWELIKVAPTLEQGRAARFLGLDAPSDQGESALLSEVVRREMNPFWQESNLLHLALGLMNVSLDSWPEILTPWQVMCSAPVGGNLDGGNFAVRITDTQPRAAHLFLVPSWCESSDEKRRFQLGTILRYALRGSTDFYTGISQRRTSVVRRYRVPVSHWEKARCSMFQGRSAFGPPWISISSWVENFLFDLLRWPGAGLSTPMLSMSEWMVRVAQRINHLGVRRGEATKLYFLEQAAPFPEKPPAGAWERPLRIGIVQSVIPDMGHYSSHPTDPQLILDPGLRSRHRSHLATILETVNQMLLLRETHQTQPRHDGRIIDLLVFPELAVHPQDIDSLIVNFVQSQKCILLFGQVYHPCGPNPASSLINSCLWAIPEWSVTSGFQIRRVEQGKQHLTAGELSFNPAPVSFRPNQWIVEYQWSSNLAERPLRLTASICYDATDLALAADLKGRSDLYLVCALNRDVGTFDRMSEGLSYHMFQGTVLVNNGQFGGSNFYMPYRQQFERQVFHLHGQPQATVAFAEVSPRKLIYRPIEAPGEAPIGQWKTPPANWILL